MRNLSLFNLVPVLVIALARAAEAADENGTSEAVTVASKISEVTVYADRARVTRAANVALRNGPLRFAFRKLPGWIDEGSVRVGLVPPAAGEIVDVQVEKTFLARPEDEELRKAEASVTEVSDQLGALEDEAASLDAQGRQTDAIRAFSLEKLPKDTAVREVKIEEYSAVVKFVGNSMLEVARGRREIEKKKRDLQPELRARQQKLTDLRQKAQLEQRTVIVSIKGAKDGQAALNLSYLLPGTTWEPVHELRGGQDASSVTLASYAVVTQTTGEDWDGAALTFSTQRPNATARIPELEALLVGGGRSLARMVNPEGDTFQMALANFEGQNGVWNSINNRYAPQMQAFTENVQSQKARQARVAEMFQQVQQRRGTTAQFPALAVQTIRTDGRSVRVPIGSARFTATPRIVAAPELSLNAVQSAELTNTCGQPLLPGKVLLYAEGAFTGTTETEFVAPGENFSVFLGVADRLKLSRTIDQKRSSVTWTGKRKRMLAAFLVSAENLSDKPVAFQLADRIPVSETDEIRVQGVKLQPEVKPDVKGLLKWDVTLAEKTKKEFRIEYTLDYPAQLPTAIPTLSSALPTLPPSSASAGRRMVEGKKEASAAPNAPPPAATESESLYRQIDLLEQSIKK